jgi:subtilisin family serine protease
MKRLFILIIVSLLAGCSVSGGRFPILAEDGGTSASNRILVTFVDRSIDRAVQGNPADGYRSRGLYANSGWSQRVSAELAERYGLRLLAQWPVTTLGVACVVYEVPPGRPVAGVLETLSRDDHVGLAQSMREYRVLGQEASNPAGYNDPYLKLQKGFQALRVEQAHRMSTGKGVRIAVIDTGVDDRHPDLAGHITTTENLAPISEGAGTADVHGTAVAGVLAAQPGNGIGIAGVAPDAEILSLRSCWPDARGAAAARCNSYTLALGLNEAIRRDVNVINLSLTGPDDPLVRLLLEEAIRRRIVIVAAMPQRPDGGRFPADMPGVIAVADDASPHPDALSAPGHDVLTTMPFGAYDFISGSSLAAPHVSGIIALLLESDPRIDTVMIRRLLEGGEARAPLDAAGVLILAQRINANLAQNRN